MRSFLIVGAGQAGLQLGLALRAEGHRVTLLSARTADEIENGRPTSTQAMFGPALDTEAAYGLDHWAGQAPSIAGLHVVLAAPPGTLALQFTAPLDRPARSVDQRIKFARWLRDAEEQGIEVIHESTDLAGLAALTAGGDYDLTIVAAGRGDLTAAFDRDPERSPCTEPQRGLAFAYVHGLAPDPARPEPHVEFHAIPGLGELFVIPVLTRSGACDALFWEAVPGGPLDIFGDAAAAAGGRLDPVHHLELTLGLIKEHLPWFAERCGDLRLTDDQATLHGRYTPTVRKPVAHLPGGGLVLGIGDVVLSNDPITGQGSNTAAKAAHHYLTAILQRGDLPFDAEWMSATFESFWAAHGQAVTFWTNAMLQPLPPHVQQLLGAASQDPRIAARFARGFTDPNDFFRWFVTPELAGAYLAELNPA